MARAPPPRTSARFSSHTSRARRRARDWAWPSSASSSPTTAAPSTCRARSGGAPPSASTCRSRPESATIPAMMGGEPTDARRFLGIEGGGTRTVALLADERGHVLKRLEVGPLNLKLLSDSNVLKRLREIRRRAPQPSSLALCLAGCRDAADRSRARSLAERVWPQVPAYVGSDMDSVFAAAFGPTGSGIVIVSGTGSCVYGRGGTRVARAGGWGHLLGDHGSGYWIALTGLRASIREYDRRGHINKRLGRVLRRLHLNSAD